MKRYKIISELGKGATGVVFRAVRNDDGSTVALKKLVLPGHLDANEEQDFIRRFKSEAQAALALKHPGIVSALDCGLDEGTFFIAYELVEGVTLEEALKASREFTPDEVADLINQASDALAYAHREGVVHRDLSPGNIFLTDDGKVRIADFGVAGFLTKTTMTSDKDTIVGTPGYMAPEQIKGGEADPRSDIFSIGCVAYELLTGKQAFTGDNLAQIIHRVMSEQPKPIRDLNPKVPVQLEELVFRMLAKNPDYRYQNMDEVVIAATRVLDEMPKTRKTEQMIETGHAPVLVGIAGPLEGQKFQLQPTVTTIGKKVGDIILGEGPGIAPQHAWITKEETGWVLYDAETESGTFLNGERIEREEILPGDKIQIGSVVLEFRGAGGHKGAFQDATLQMIEVDEKAGKAGEVPSKKVPWLVIVLIMIPAFIIFAGLIYAGIYLPYKFRSALNEITNPRWDSAFSKLDATIIGGPEWNLDAMDVLSQWQADPLGGEISASENLSGGPSEFMTPALVLGNRGINDEVLYRFQLFQLAEEFLLAATSQSGSSIDTVNPSYQVVRGLEPRIDGMKVPAGIADEWVGRKNQLLSIVRRWIAANGAGTTRPGNAGPSGYEAERTAALDSLLNGWYTYQEAGTDIQLLDAAFVDFQTCIQSLDAVLVVNPGEQDASCIRGLAYFLGAKILRTAGDRLGPDRYQRGLDFLDSATLDIAGVSPEAWDRAIPVDFKTEFPSPNSLNAQIRALSLTLNNLLSNANQNSSGSN